ncbi:CU044_5270 family protein [Arthrobacter sp. B6]|uniref:CU044_5270 family protein n=1 Tax=Arthrobacter sp. B6 TaxID=1570137 RepID=UPI00082AF21E|nr:CU044_5270 family protein [Arthrobacter sp. B6]
MNTSQFQSDRREALRRQLVELPTLTGAEDPLRYRPGKAAPSHHRRNRRAGYSEATVEVSPPARPRPTRRVLLMAAAAAVGALAVGQISVTAQSAHAAGVLRAAADQSMTFVDPAPGPGQYLLVHTHANWLVSGIDEAGNMKNSMNAQTIDVYRPSDPDADWVLRRDWGDAHPVPMEIEVIRAKDGHFYGGPWTLMSDDELAALPRDGQALYDHFNSSYQGGSASRDENNFVRITDILRMGLIPADLRAGLYQALALIPGVNASEQANFDGKVGIAIGRTEPLRAGQRAEMIIDPDTGLVIGERTIMTYAAFGFGSNEVVGHTAIDYRIVDSAPQ